MHEFANDVTVSPANSCCHWHLHRGSCTTTAPWNHTLNARQGPAENGGSGQHLSNGYGQFNIWLLRIGHQCVIADSLTSGTPTNQQNEGATAFSISPQIPVRVVSQISLSGKNNVFVAPFLYGIFLRFLGGFFSKNRHSQTFIVGQ